MKQVIKAIGSLLLLGIIGIITVAFVTSVVLVGIRIGLAIFS